MDLFHGLSDDQTALIGCVAALFVCGTIMSLSYYVGLFFQKSQHSPEPKEPYTLRMPDPLTLQSKKIRHIHSSAAEGPIRRAA